MAAIDVGSNATRLTVLAADGAGVERARLERRFPLRLGADVFASGEVGPQLAARLADTFREVAHLLDAEGVSAYRAVATSAMREARNGPEVVRQIAEASGLDLEVIGGAAEGRLGRAALVRSVGSLHSDSLIVDLGGGSCELTRPRARRGRSVPVGSVRLLNLWPALAGCLTAAELGRARAFVAGWVRRELGRAPRARLAVGTGGTLDVLARTAGRLRRGVPHLEVAALEPLVSELAGMSAAARRARLDVGADRADLVLPAALIVLAMAEAVGIEALVVPGVGLRDGLLEGLLTPASPGETARRLLGGHEHGALARRSARLAAELFADLAAVHGLWPPALDALVAAVHAWYLGAHLDPSQAEQHAAYLLSQVAPLALPEPGCDVALFALASLRPGAPARGDSWPPRRPRWQPWPSGGEGPPPSVGDGDGDGGEVARRAAWALAGVLRLALTLAPLARRQTALSVDVLADPVRIEADLSVPLTRATLAPLEEALGRAIEVR